SAGLTRGFHRVAPFSERRDEDALPATSVLLKLRLGSSAAHRDGVATAPLVTSGRIVTRSQIVHAVVDFIDRQSAPLTTGTRDKDANILSYFAYFALREAWPCSAPK